MKLLIETLATVFSMAGLNVFGYQKNRFVQAISKKGREKKGRGCKRDEKWISEMKDERNEGPGNFLLKIIFNTISNVSLLLLNQPTSNQQEEKNLLNFILTGKKGKKK